VPKLSFFLASSYVNKPHMREIRDKLAKMGHRVIARWIDEPHSPHSKIGDFEDAELSAMSDRDVEDIRDVDVLAHFTGENERGGAKEECGMSIGMRLEGLDMQTFVVGPRVNVHDYNYLVDHFPTEEEFLEWAEKEARR
jgi:hypothetical protein